MTLSITASACTYTGDGSTVAFDVKSGSDGIYFETASELYVTIRSSDTVTAQTNGVDYTVSGAGSAAGVVTFNSAPANGVEVRIERRTPLTQTLALSNGGTFSPVNIMGAFDKLTRALQDAYRATQQSWAGTYSGVPLTLTPSGAAWDGDSKRLTNLDDPTDDQDAATKVYVDTLTGDFGSATLTSGTITTGAAGTDAAASITGTHPNYTLNLTIPRGDPGANGTGTGDVVGPAASVASELVLFDGTTGKLVKRATTTGLLKGTSGVLSAAVAGTDYAAATSGTSVLKGDGAGGTTAAAATDLGAGKHTLFIPAGALIPRTTNGPATGTVELATNDVMLSVLDFDTSTEEGAGFWVAMPKSWNEGTVTFQALWTAASGSGGVAWGLAAYSFSDDDAMDTAVSGQQIVTDTLLTANDMHITSESSAITIGGSPAEGDAVYFELTREVANGSDTIAVDVRLIGLRLFLTTNAITDA